MRIHLVARVPALTRVLSNLVPKFLDFSDYKRTRTRIRNLEYQVSELQYRLQSKQDIDSYYSQLLSLLQPVTANYRNRGFSIVRVGSQHDGGYFITQESASCCRWVTFGLGSNVEFERQLVEQGCTVDSFDHSLDIPPSLRSPHFKWHKRGIGKVSNSNFISLRDLEIEQVIQPGTWHLKFDVEGSEWDILDEISNMDNPPQTIACELHGLRWSTKESDNSDRLHRLSCLMNVYDVVCISGNNYSANLVGAKSSIHDVVELLLVKVTRRDRQRQTATFSLPNHPNDPLGPQTRTELCL